MRESTVLLRNFDINCREVKLLMTMQVTFIQPKTLMVVQRSQMLTNMSPYLTNSIKSMRHNLDERNTKELPLIMEHKRRLTLKIGSANSYLKGNHRDIVMKTGLVEAAMKNTKSNNTHRSCSLQKITSSLTFS